MAKIIQTPSPIESKSKSRRSLIPNLQRTLYSRRKLNEDKI